MILRISYSLFLQGGDLTWVTTGAKYNIDEAVKNLAVITKSGKFGTTDLSKGGYYLFPVAFTVTSITVKNL